MTLQCVFLLVYCFSISKTIVLNGMGFSIKQDFMDSRTCNIHISLKYRKNIKILIKITSESCSTNNAESNRFGILQKYRI